MRGSHKAFEYQNLVKCISKFQIFQYHSHNRKSSCVCSTNLSIAGAPWFDAFFQCEVCIRPRWFAHCNWAFENPCDSPCHYSRLYIRRSYRRQLRSVPCKLLGFCKKKEIGLNKFTVVHVTNRVGTLSIWRGASHMW